MIDESEGKANRLLKIISELIIGTKMMLKVKEITSPREGLTYPWRLSKGEYHS
jgi:hypothetical protein